MTSEFFGRQRECRFYTAGCGNKMAVSVTGPCAVNELGGPVTPGIGDQCNMVSSERYIHCHVTTFSKLPQLSIGTKRLLWCATKPQHVSVLPLLTISVVG